MEQEASLPDGRVFLVRVGLAEDSYIPRREVDTVTIELLEGGEVAASVNTVLGPEHETEARALVHQVATRLETGELEPTAGALEPLADTIP
ncbi:MAG TPA: hypothetical protein VFL61_06790 [Gaiellaceae bacterium]|nr:hypothetical protein [Gaiellaceae bacterium]